MSEKRYTEEHEWVELDGSVATVGITDYAQEQLGDLVFVELPEIGKTVEKGEELAVIESVKAASEVYAPVGGTVTEANETLAETPETVNQDAEGKGWFARLQVENGDEFEALMTEEAYRKFVEDLD